MEEWNVNLPVVETPKNPSIRKKAKKVRRQKKRGRKKIKRRFEQTTLGNSIRLNAPLEYDMIVSVSDSEPEADLIEQISYSSINPYFRSAIFRKLFIKYRQNGCHQRVPIPPPTPETKMRTLQVRRKRMYGF